MLCFGTLIFLALLFGIPGNSESKFLRFFGPMATLLIGFIVIVVGMVSAKTLAELTQGIAWGTTLGGQLVVLGAGSMFGSVAGVFLGDFLHPTDADLYDDRQFHDNLH